MSQVATGHEIAGYRIEAYIGRGGMGEVYRATQLSLARTVALKLIAAELARNHEFQSRFRHEAQVAASLEHTNVLPVYEVGEADGLLFLSMRYVEGPNLAELLAGGALAPARAVRIVAQVADALDEAHAHGLVHRDVKPANILLEDPGGREHAYLSDFGLSKLAAVSESPTQTGQLLGTVDYLAPEAIEAGGVDGRSDVYSLGCVLWEALTGTVVFPRTSPMAKLWGHVYDEPPVLTDARPGLAPGLDDVLQRALAKEPSERYPSAGDLGRAAVAVLEGRRVAEPERSVAVGEAARARPAQVPPRGRGRPRPRTLVALAAVALAAGAGVVGGWAAFGRSDRAPDDAAAAAPPSPPAQPSPAGELARRRRAGWPDARSRIRRRRALRHQRRRRHGLRDGRARPGGRDPGARALSHRPGHRRGGRSAHLVLRGARPRSDEHGGRRGSGLGARPDLLHR